MLEVKNVVSRDITGNPLTSHWIQMQHQMEVCNLDTCDFLETKFTFYTDRQEYYNDVMGPSDCSKSKDGKVVGELIHFGIAFNPEPFYVYRPLTLTTQIECEKWESDMIDKYTESPFNYCFIQYQYWKLDIFSCVVVPRNKQWFQAALPIYQDLWNTIEEERKSGYEHRAPKKRALPK